MGTVAADIVFVVLKVVFRRKEVMAHKNLGGALRLPRTPPKRGS